MLLVENVPYHLVCWEKRRCLRTAEHDQRAELRVFGRYRLRCDTSISRFPNAAPIASSQRSSRVRRRLWSRRFEIFHASHSVSQKASVIPLSQKHARRLGFVGKTTGGQRLRRTTPRRFCIFEVHWRTVRRKTRQLAKWDRRLEVEDFPSRFDFIDNLFHFGHFRK